MVVVLYRKPIVSAKKGLHYFSADTEGACNIVLGRVEVT
jgi:hypothetical protein